MEKIILIILAIIEIILGLVFINKYQGVAVSALLFGAYHIGNIVEEFKEGKE